MQRRVNVVMAQYVYKDSFTDNKYIEGITTLLSRMFGKCYEEYMVQNNLESISPVYYEKLFSPILNLVGDSFSTIAYMGIYLKETGAFFPNSQSNFESFCKDFISEIESLGKRAMVDEKTHTVISDNSRYLISIGPVYNGKNVIGFAWVCSLIQIEEIQKLTQAAKLDTFAEVAGYLANEFRDPIAMILSSLQLLPQRLDDRIFLYSFIRITTQELVRINDKIESFLNFATYSKPNFSTVDVNSLTEKVLTFCEVIREAKKITVKKEFAVIPTIEADEKQLGHALNNIILNSIQSMNAGGILTISTSYEKGSSYLLIKISDTGRGIKDEDKKRIFDIFYSTNEGGIGLGLAWVKRIIDLHDGVIEFESIEKCGTVFYIKLPVEVKHWQKDNI